MSYTFWRARRAAVLAVGTGAVIAVVGLVPAEASVAPPAAVFRANVHAASFPVGESPAGGLTSCYSQTVGDTGDSVLSQTFTDSDTHLPPNDSYGADDFTLSAPCRLKQVVALGQYFFSQGPAQSETVQIWKDKHGVPGAVVYDGTMTGLDDHGTFTLKIKPKVKLHANVHYWLSVSVNMEFYHGGEWGWETTADQNGLPALWENPGGARGTDCDTWSIMRSCFDDSQLGPDFMFSLQGALS
jgi:hypothetical protein